MIFTAVKELHSKTEKSFFTEQTIVYKRLVEVYCEKNKKNIETVSEIKSNIVDELISIGAINEESDIP